MYKLKCLNVSRINLNEYDQQPVDVKFLQLTKQYRTLNALHLS